MLDQLQPGTLIADRFRIDRLLSRGGMGAVYQANQIGLDRPVALKLLLPTFSEDAKMRERFQREARSAALLSHPNIIQIYDYGVSDWGPYIVMELVRGESLRSLIARGAVSPELSLQIISQVCAAVATAHDSGIIHRDLKPDNILIEERTDGYFVKVLDFGIAKLRDARESATTDTADLTGTNVIGSPNYMSPEQCMGLELDPRADIYSLGIVLYEMLTGSVPFSDSSAVKVLMQQVNEMPRRLSELRADITGAIESVVFRALAKDRTQRHASALHLASEFKLALEKPATFDTQITSVVAESVLLQAVPSQEIQNSNSTNVMPTLMVDEGPSSKQPCVSMPVGSSAGPSRRLAILPLRNLTGDPDIEYLGFALADSVITQLCCVKCLIVRPSSAIEKYRGKAVDLAQVGEELHVDTILTGSYLRSGEAFRVTAQLIDIARNEILWQERIDAKFDNVFALQDRICEALINGLRLRLSTSEQEALKQDESVHPLTHELLMRAVACGNTLEDHRRALDLLESAVKLDANYAPAWAALGGRYVASRHYFHDESLLRKAESALRKALELKPQLPVALFWLALYYGEINDLKNGLAAIRKLMEVAPNTEYAYQAMAFAYSYAGLPDVALALFRKANEINPLAYPQMIGVLLYQKGEFDEARKTLESNPQRDIFPEISYWLAILDLMEGNHQAAAETFRILITLPGAIKMHEMCRGLLASIKGETEEGRRIVRTVTDSGYKLPAFVYYLLAQIYAQLKDADSCFEMVHEAINHGYGNYPFLMSDPMLNPVRSHPDFKALSERMHEQQTQLQLMLVAGDGN